MKPIALHLINLSCSYFVRQLYVKSSLDIYSTGSNSESGCQLHRIMTRSAETELDYKWTVQLSLKHYVIYSHLGLTGSHVHV